VNGSIGEESQKSNQLCIEAALAILEHQRRVSEETQPGGLMFNDRWKMASTLNHEFLQATMMLCFALSREFNHGNVGTTASCALHGRDDILEVLTIAKGLWEKNANRSAEARRAVEAITTVLQQDLNKSSASTWTASEGELLVSVVSQSTKVGNSAGLFEQMPGIGEQSYLGSFDYGLNMGLDHSVLGDDDITAFGSMFDDFAT
jgi:hypothetical protein